MRNNKFSIVGVRGMWPSKVILNSVISTDHARIIITPVQFFKSQSKTMTTIFLQEARSKPKAKHEKVFCPDSCAG